MKIEKIWTFGSIVVLGQLYGSIAYGAQADVNLENCIKKSGDAQLAACEVALKSATKSNKATILFNRGKAWAFKGYSDKAIADFSAAITLNPKHFESFDHRGWEYFQADKHKLAMADFDAAIALNAKYARARNHRGVILSHARKRNDAIKAYTKAINLNPKYVGALINRAVEFRTLKKYIRALEDLNKANFLSPNNHHVLHGLARVYSAQRKYKLAIKTFDQALKLNPSHGLSYLYRCDAYDENGQRGYALADCNKAVELLPENGDAYYLRGYILFHADKEKPALADLNKALSLKTTFNRANIFQYRGMTHYYLKNYKTAKTDLSQALKLDDKLSYAHRYLGLVLRTENQTKLALQHLIRAKTLKPNDVDILLDLGNAYGDVKQYINAIKTNKNVLKLDSKNKGALYNVAYFYDDLKQPTDVIKALNNLLQHYPKHHEGLNFRAWVLYETGKAGKGLKDAELAVKLLPTASRYLDTLGHIYRTIGRKNEAREQFKKALKIDPKLQSSLDGLKKLDAK